jgi:hypothetical protein
VRRALFDQDVKESIALRFVPALLRLQQDHRGVCATPAQLVPEPVALRAQLFQLVAMIQLGMNIEFFVHVFTSFHMCVVCLSVSPLFPQDASN